MGAYSGLDDAQRAELRRQRDEKFAAARDTLNRMAASLAPQLLRNGRKAGAYWEASNIRDDNSGTFSLKVNLTGDKIGCWTDFALSKGMPGRSGDIFSLLLEREHGGDFKAAVAAALRISGIEGMSEREFREARRRSAAAAEKASKEEEKRQNKNKGSAWLMWHGAYGLVHDGAPTPALRYLEGRGIDFARLGRVPSSLRYHPEVWNTETAKRLGRGHAKLPAMVACVVGLDGSFLGVHRHWLDVSGGKGGPVKKAALEDPKKSLGNSKGGHIPVWKGRHRCTLRQIPAGTDVYMSEGVEDALSVAMANPSLRVIAGVSLSKMGEVDLPEQMGNLVFICQNDPIGSDAAEALEAAIALQQGRGRTVRTMWPDEAFKDFNDVLMGKRRT